MGNQLILFKEALNRSILDFSDPGKSKCDFLLPHKINYLKKLILTVHPCTAGNSVFIRVSLDINWILVKITIINQQPAP